MHAAQQRQIDLFSHVGGAYAQPSSGRLSNVELYRIVAGRAGVPAAQLDAKTPIGRAATLAMSVKLRRVLEVKLVLESHCGVA